MDPSIDRRRALGAIGSGAISLLGLSGCGQRVSGNLAPDQRHEPGWRDLSLFPPKPPAVNWDLFPNAHVFISGNRGWSTGQLETGWGSGLQASLEILSKQAGIPCIATRVHYWEDNMLSINEAVRRTLKVVLVGYSAGCDQVMMTIDRCNNVDPSQRIFIDLAVFFDPTFTSQAPLPIFTTTPRRPFKFPKNVGKVVVFMSGGSLLDPFGPGQGSPAVVNAAAAEDSRIEPAHVFRDETHYSLGRPKFVVPHLLKYLRELDPTIPTLTEKTQRLKSKLEPNL